MTAVDGSGYDEPRDLPSMDEPELFWSRPQEVYREPEASYDEVDPMTPYVVQSSVSTLEGHTDEDPKPDLSGWFLVMVFYAGEAIGAARFTSHKKAGRWATKVIREHRGAREAVARA